MTFDKYIFTSFLKAIKIHKGTTSLTAANHEARVIHEGLELLGFYNREHIEPIDELKSAYYEVQSLTEKIHELENDEAKIGADLNESIDRRTEEREKQAQNINTLTQEKLELINKRGKLAKEQASINNEGSRLVQVHDGLEEKKQHSSDHSQVNEKIKQCLFDLKNLKLQRDKIDSSYKETLNAIKLKNESIKEAQQVAKSSGSSIEFNVGDVNKKLADNQVVQARLTNKLHEHYTEIGRFLYENRKTRSVKKCIKSRRQIISQLSALYKSVQLNKRLSGA